MSAYGLPESCLHRLFEERARAAPGDVAILHAAGATSYGELNAAANRLARHLIGLGARPEVPVGLCLESTPERVIAILAILKTGGAYLPLDPGYPEARLGQMLEDAQVPLLVTTSGLADRLPGAGARPLFLDQIGDEVERQADDDPQIAVAPDNLAYVIYTSGSTGTPKGIAIRHLGAANNLLDLIHSYGIGTGDRILALSSLSFDMCVFELLGTLAAGAAVVLPEPSGVREPGRWAELVQRHRVTVWNSAPALLEIFLDHVEPRQEVHPRSLRLALLGGDWLPLAQPDRLRRLAPGVRVVSLGGATEASIHSTVYEVGKVEPDWASIPYGRAMRGQTASVLDGELLEAPTGEAGELYLGGIGLARGYLGRPAQTAARFLPDPLSPTPGGRLFRTGDLARWKSDGNIELLGRIDHQVKIRGQRVELREIEARLAADSEVAEAVVVGRGGGRDGLRLVAYVVAARDRNDRPAADGPGVDHWEAIYDQTHGTGDSTPPGRDFTGWVSSFASQPFTRDELDEVVDRTVERIRSLAPRHVLEIGCGTGLLLFELAPDCQRYDACDISRAALASVRRRLQAEDRVLPQLTLTRRRADDLDDVPSGRYDTVVLNSVIQHFPGRDYLQRVLRGALRVTEPGGLLFLGDLRNLALLDAFHAAVELDRAEDWLPISELQARVERRRAREQELWVDPRLFESLASDLPEIGRCELMTRRLGRENEVSLFHYDVLLHRAPARARGNAGTGRLGSAAPGSGPFLHRPRPQRLSEAIEASRLLLQPRSLRTVGELRDALRDSARRQPPSPVPSVASGSRWVNQPASRSGGAELAASLRRRLRRHLPETMVPADFVFLERLPLSPNGKVDRAALPAPERSRAGLQSAYEAPRTPLEEAVAGIWSEVLEVAPVGRQDNLFELGGHSLNAARIVSRVNRLFDLELPLSTIFEYPRVAALAARIEEAQGRPAADQCKPATGSGGRSPGDAPLSFHQEALWFLNRLGGEREINGVPAALRLRGPLDRQALDASLEAIRARHPALRTVFEEKAGVPRQLLAAGDWRLSFVDLRGEVAGRRLAAARQLMREEAARPFDLGRGPLLRATLARLGTEEHVLVLNLHHIVADGWSLGILLDELRLLYPALAGGAAPKLPEPPVGYGDFAVWQRDRLAGSVGERLGAYWKEQLQGAPEFLDLPGRQERRPSPSYRGRHLPIVLPDPLSRRLRALARGLQASLHTVLLAAFKGCLGAWTAAEDIVVGCTFANRVRSDWESVVGHFANTLPLRTSLAGDPRFSELVAHVAATARGAQAHQEYPFALLVKELRARREPGRNPLFQVVFDLLTPDHNPPLLDYGLDLPVEETVPLDQLELSPFGFDNRVSRFDLSVFLWDLPDGLAGSIEFNSDLLDRAAVANMVSGFQRFLRSAVEAPQDRLSALSAGLGRSLDAPETTGPQAYRRRLHDSLLRARRKPAAKILPRGQAS